MKYLLICVLTLLLLTGCHHVYMPNMVGGGNAVDVSEMIEKEHYKPLYCGDEICKLINPHPSPITAGEANQIGQRIISNLGGLSFGDSLNEKVLSQTQYGYTYFITYDPVDVYELSISTGERLINMEIRREKGNLILPESLDPRWEAIMLSKTRY